MALSALIRKAVSYYRENGPRATIRMSSRYARWRLTGGWFLFKHNDTIADAGNGLKIRGDVRLHDTRAEHIEFGDRIELAGDLGRPTFFKVSGDLVVADDVFVNRGCEIYASTAVKLARGAILAPGVIIRDSDVHAVGGGSVEREPVTIGKNAWLGTRRYRPQGRNHRRKCCRRSRGSRH